MSLLTLEFFFGFGWRLEAVDEEALDGAELVAESAGDDTTSSCPASVDAMIAAKNGGCRLSKS